MNIQTTTQPPHTRPVAGMASVGEYNHVAVDIKGHLTAVAARVRERQEHQAATALAAWIAIDHGEALLMDEQFDIDTAAAAAQVTLRASGLFDQRLWTTGAPRDLADAAGPCCATISNTSRCWRAVGADAIALLDRLDQIGLCAAHEAINERAAASRGQLPPTATDELPDTEGGSCD